MKTKRVFLLGSLALFIAAAPVLTPPPAFALTAGEITNELTCTCACNLLVGACASTMECSAAKDMTDKVTQLIDQGKSKNAIIQVLTREYGERILAAPTKKGFNLTAWILPFVALLLGGAFVFFFVGRCLKARQEEAAAGRKSSVLSSEEAKYFSQFEKELKDFEI